MNSSEMESKPQNRWLIFHPESDCYFEVFTEDALDQALCEGNCCDTTGIKDHEEAFLMRKDRDNNNE